MSIDDDRNHFVNLATELLRTSAPFFDLKGIAAAGRRLGFLSQQEADSVQNMGHFPRWMATIIRRKYGLTLEAGTATGITRRILVNACTVATGAPTTAPGTHMPSQFLQRSTDVPAIELCSGNASRHNMLNFARLALLPNGSIDAWSEPDSDLYKPFLDAVDPYPLHGHCFLGVVEGATIYAHWLLDTLPRLLVLLDKGYDLACYDSFFLTSKAADFYKVTLQMLGIDPAKVIERNRIGPYVSCESFDYVTNIRRGFAASPRVYEMVRSFFLGTPASYRRSSTHRLFISRAGASRRRVLNEDELVKLLRSRGFEVVELEDYTISEAAIIVAEASHVIAPHGAGLANLVFASTGTRVLEIFSGHISVEYWKICSQRGLDYHAFEALGPDGSA